jgi:ectoine hydroxylase
MLEAEDLRKFASEGLLMPRWRFKESLVDRLLAQLPQLDRHESTVLEFDRQTPRAFHGGHEDAAVFAELTRRSVLLRSVQQILQDRVHVYQFKVNLKAAFAGDTWPWHQDYSFWLKEDAMLECVR